MTERSQLALGGARAILVVAAMLILPQGCTPAVGICGVNPADPRCRDGGERDADLDGPSTDSDPDVRRDRINDTTPPDDGSDGTDADAMDCDAACMGLCGDLSNGCRCGNTCVGGRVCGEGNLCTCPEGSDECGTGACIELATSDDHCGRCDHSCFGDDACQAGTCQPVELASGQAAPTAIAVAGSDVYWVNRDPNGAVMTLSLMGGEPVPVATGQFNPRAIAVDATQVFWVNETSGEVQRAARAGFAPTLVTDEGDTAAPSGVAVDDSFVYWVNLGAGTVRRKLKTAGPGVMPQLLASTQVSPIDIAVAGSAILWVNNGSAGDDGTLMRLGAGDPLATAQEDPQAIAADASAVYWANQAGGTIMTVALTGGEPIPLADSQASPADVAIDATHVYWVNHVAAPGGGLYRVAKDGSDEQPEPLAEGLDFPRGLFVTADSVFFVTDANGTGQGAVYRIALP